LGLREKREQKKAAKAASAVLPIDALVEDPLEALLDEQSDEEFGDLILRDAKRKVTGQKVKLAEWTAQDFSSIYVRFRPHLERHARRFLSNPSQVDEVVQDAFLYLMVSLPELDSEIGVLRFLKWKTRLLALDVIRASGKAYINSIDDVPEPESADPEVSNHLEQQDDAAVVKLALSKLNPRHREVLIASMYEEKSTEQIADQVGLSENATRQLIFRARAAFKKALIGEVDTTGMSAAAILSVAARKAASEGKKVGAAALTLVALVVMTLTVGPALNGGRSQDNVAGPVIEPTNPSSSSTPAPSATGGEQSPEPSPQPSGSSDPEPMPESGESVSAAPGTPSPSPSSSSSSELLSDENLSGVFGSSRLAKVVLFDKRVVATDPNGVSAEFVFNPSANTVFTGVMATIDIDDMIFTVYPDKSEILSAVDSDGLTRYYLFGSMTYIFDEDGRVWSESDLAKGTLRIEVVMEKNGYDIKQVLVSIISKG
jgi:RNA polymerase sigma factor (sigma-70 family)